MPFNPKEYIGPHFKYDEFRCKCCGQLPPQGIDPNLILKLEILRMLLGDKPIIISSGYRCRVYNKAINGAPNSQHMYGKAADIIMQGTDSSKVAAAAESIFQNGGLGRYKDFTHVDTRGRKVRW
jgi:uncharacterized protein YcbK (DUF882 family)